MMKIHTYCENVLENVINDHFRSIKHSNFRLRQEVIDRRNQNAKHEELIQQFHKKSKRWKYFIIKSMNLIAKKIEWQRSCQWLANEYNELREQIGSDTESDE